jgi:hypothetical protein
LRNRNKFLHPCKKKKKLFWPVAHACLKIKNRAKRVLKQWLDLITVKNEEVFLIFTTTALSAQQ